MLKMDLAASDPDFAGGAVGEKNDTGRHLLGESENVCCVGPGGLKPDRNAQPSQGWDLGRGNRKSGYAFLISTGCCLFSRDRYLFSP